jgi:hypothetical protein
VKNYFNELIEIMQKEAELYMELKDLEEEKKEVIINNDVKALDAMTRKEQGFVKTIVQLESLRTQAVDGLCREKGHHKIDILTELYDILNPFEQQQLKVFELKLMRAVDDIQKLNQVNSKLIEQSLEFIDVTLTLAQALGVEDAGYGKDAEGREVKVKKGLFDAKV